MIYIYIFPHASCFYFMSSNSFFFMVLVNYNNPRPGKCIRTVKIVHFHSISAMNYINNLFSNGKCFLFLPIQKGFPWLIVARVAQGHIYSPFSSLYTVALRPIMPCGIKSIMGLHNTSLLATNRQQRWTGPQCVNISVLWRSWTASWVTDHLYSCVGSFDVPFHYH